jgi:acetylornithine deacetylase
MSVEDPLALGSLARLTAELVAIPSVNPALDPQGGGEEPVATFARDWLERRGVRAWLEPVAPGRPNVVAEVGGGEGPTLVLCAHLDTVGTTGMADAFSPRVEGGRLYGRGAYDMKASAAAVMAAPLGWDESRIAREIAATRAFYEING